MPHHTTQILVTTTSVPFVSIVHSLIHYALTDGFCHPHTEPGKLPYQFTPQQEHLWTRSFPEISTTITQYLVTGSSIQATCVAVVLVCPDWSSWSSTIKSHFHRFTVLSAVPAWLGQVVVVTAGVCIAITCCPETLFIYQWWQHSCWLQSVHVSRSKLTDSHTEQLWQDSIVGGHFCCAESRCHHSVSWGGHQNCNLPWDCVARFVRI
jgi:hypothetical protein